MKFKTKIKIFRTRKSYNSELRLLYNKIKNILCNYPLIIHKYNSIRNTDIMSYCFHDKLTRSLIDIVNIVTEKNKLKSIGVWIANNRVGDLNHILLKNYKYPNKPSESDFNNLELVKQYVNYRLKRIVSQLIKEHCYA